MAASLKVAEEFLSVVARAATDKSWVKCISPTAKPKLREPLRKASEVIIKKSINDNGWDENELFLPNLQTLVKEVFPKEWWENIKDFLQKQVAKKQAITFEFLQAEIQEERLLACGISAATWRRFLDGESVKNPAFNAFCEILNQNPKEIGVGSAMPSSPGSFTFKPSQITVSPLHCPPLSASSFAPPEPANFVSRPTKLKEIKQAIETLPVLQLWGQPGIGKSYIAAQIAKTLSEDYKICWLDKPGLVTLEELLRQINDFLRTQGESGIVNTYGEDQIAINNKIAALVEIIRESQFQFAFFIDICPGLQQFKNSSAQEIQPLKEFQPFIERFITHGGKSRVFLIDYSPPQNSLKPSLAAKVKSILLEGFQGEEISDYLNILSEPYGIKWSPEDVTAVLEKTGGHPIALALIVLRRQQGVSLNDILEGLVEDDKRFGGGELSQKLLEEVSRYLSDEEKKALHKLSVFRIPISRSAWRHLDISSDIGNALWQRHFLTPVSLDGDRFQIHPLIRQFWKADQSLEKISQWHEKAANYYLDEESQCPLNERVRLAYHEAHHHFLEIKRVEAAARVVNELVYRLHEQERLPAERIPILNTWLFQLDDSTFEDKPWLLVEKGRRLDTNGCLEEAESIFQKACRAFEQQEDQLGQAVALYSVGKMLALQKQPQLALETMNSVLRLPNVQADYSMQIRTLGKIIDCYIELGRYEEAEHDANEALELAELSGDALGYALILYEIGSIKRRQGCYSEAEELFRDGVRRFEELKDIYRQSKALSRLGLVQYYQGKYQEATANFQEAIDLKGKIDDLQGKARDLDYLADVYTRRGLYDKAETRYQDSLQIKKGVNEIEPDVYGQIKAYNNFAKVALLTEDLSKADDYLQESERLINRQNEQPINLKGVHLRLQGDLQFARGKYEDALQAYEDSAACFKSPHPEVPNSYGFALFGLGKTYFEIRNLSLSKQYLEDALSSFQQFSMPYDEALVLLYLARLEALKGHIKEAKDQEKKAREIAKRIDAQHILIECLETQGLIEEIKFLNSCNFAEIKEDEPAPDIKNLISSEVSSSYDEAILLISSKKLLLTQARLKIKKYLWRLTVKNLYRESISPDDSYQALLKELFASKIIHRELLRTKYTLSRPHELSDVLVANVADCALAVLSPLAKRFGFDEELREEVEELALKILHPGEYLEIVQTLENRFPNREQFISRLKSELEQRLKNANIQAIIYIRTKTIPSIYNKQVARQVSLDKILDLVGVRLITKSKQECYDAFSVVQNMGTFFEGKGILRESFRDFIQKPKPNGYRSLHINIEYGEPEPRIVEFQIRTQEMHLAAEVGFGVLGLDRAAHRHYKAPSVYAQPPRTRAYELAQSKERIELAIKCEAGTVSIVGEILRRFGGIEIWSVDIDRVQTLSSPIIPGDWLIVRFELGAKTRTTKEQEYLGEVLSKLVYEIQKNIIKHYWEKDREQGWLDYYLKNYYLRIDFEPSQTEIVLNLLGFLHSLCSKAKEEEKAKINIRNVVLEKLETKAGQPLSESHEVMRLELSIKDQIQKQQDKKLLEQKINHYQKETSNCCTLIISESGQKSKIKVAKLSIEEKAKLLGELTTHSSLSGNFVYVFTPKGDLKKLPSKATPIDYAYRVHTDIGNQCTGARVNGKFVPLDTNLNNGDIVEIISQKNSQPNFDWLKFVHDPHTKNKIIQGFRRAHREENVAHGREQLEKDLGKKGFEALLKSKAMQKVTLKCNFYHVEDLLAAIGYGGVKLSLVINRLREVQAQQGQELLEKEIGKIGLETLLKSEPMQMLAKQHNCHTVEDLLTALRESGFMKAVAKQYHEFYTVESLLTDIGIGEIESEQVVKRLREEVDRPKKSLGADSEINVPSPSPVTARSLAKSSSNESLIVIGGARGVYHDIAECCKPIFYQACIGFVQKQGRGISIHRENCPHLKMKSSDRYVTVEWLADLQVEVLNRKGILADITSCISSNNIHIWKNQVDTSSDEPTAVIDLRISVHSQQQLSQIFEQLKNVNDVLNVVLGNEMQNLRSQ